MSESFDEEVWLRIEWINGDDSLAREDECPSGWRPVRRPPTRTLARDVLHDRALAAPISVHDPDLVIVVIQDPSPVGRVPRPSIEMGTVGEPAKRRPIGLDGEYLIAVRAG